MLRGVPFRLVARLQLYKVKHWQYTQRSATGTLSMNQRACLAAPLTSHLSLRLSSSACSLAELVQHSQPAKSFSRRTTIRQTPQARADPPPLHLFLLEPAHIQVTAATFFCPRRRVLVLHAFLLPSERVCGSPATRAKSGASETSAGRWRAQSTALRQGGGATERDSRAGKEAESPSPSSAGEIVERRLVRPSWTAARRGDASWETVTCSRCKRKYASVKCE